MERSKQIKSIYPSPPSMPSLTNGTEGCPGVTALSVSLLLTKAALPLVLGGGWVGSVRR